MNLHEQITRLSQNIVDNLKGGSDEYLNHTEMTDSISYLIEKLIYSACMKQKEICSKQVSGWPSKVKIESEIEEDILNAPLPAEVERHYSGKEVLEIAEFSMGVGVGFCNHSPISKDIMKEKLKEILSKEYGINL